MNRAQATTEGLSKKSMFYGGGEKPLRDILKQCRIKAVKEEKKSVMNKKALKLSTVNAALEGRLKRLSMFKDNLRAVAGSRTRILSNKPLTSVGNHYLDQAAEYAGRGHAYGYGEDLDRVFDAFPPSREYLPGSDDTFDQLYNYLEGRGSKRIVKALNPKRVNARSFTEQRKNIQRMLLNRNVEGGELKLKNPR